MTTEPTPAPDTSITATPSTSITPESTATPSPPSPAAPASSWFKKLDYLLMLFVLILSFLVASFAATNSDVLLHRAIGQRLSAGTFEFGVDPFSWATQAHGPGTPATFWVHQSWLYSWLFYQLYNLIGGFGLVLGKAILFTLTIAILSRIGWNESNRWFIVIFMTLAALAVSPRLLLQPMAVSFLFFAVTLYVLARAGVFSLMNAETRPTCARGLWWLPPLFALWANLDVWFILGPLVVGLCWAATGLARWYKGASPVPGKTLGLIFAVGTAACLLNPFHVRVFQLPPELAYLAVALKIPLPEESVAAGRMLKEMHDADNADPLTLSVLSKEYWKRSVYWSNVAGMAFFPLIALGLLSFTLVALVRPQPGAPTLQVSRFVVWLVFGVMALALFRMIPFFALVAAPLSAMTLGEFLRWQQVSNAVSAARQDRGMHLARLVSFLFLLVLLYMAWPGWLHATVDASSQGYYSASRRVAWEIREDASMRRAAETLQTLKEKGEGGNVFNVGFEFAPYCAWYAPDVKCYLDPRSSLFAEQMPVYAKARRALLGQKDPENWEPLFKDHGVKELVLTSFAQNLRRDPSLGAWLLNSGQWRERYGDGQTMIFSRAPAGRPWPEMTSVEDLNRQAFGAVPPERRLNPHGTPPPPEVSIWSLYAEGLGRQPIGVNEANLHHTRFVIANKLLTEVGPRTSWLGALTVAPVVECLPGAGGAGGMTLLVTRLYFGQVFFRPDSLGPPASLILMQRAARQAVAQNSLDIQSRLTLVKANETVRRNQEDFWIKFEPGRRTHPAHLRDRMRQVQKMTDLSIAAQLPALGPLEAFEIHETLAKLCAQQNMLDLCLDHLRNGLKALQDYKSLGRNVDKSIDQVIKQQNDKVEQLDGIVRSHVARWKDLSEGKSSFMQAQLAIAGKYVELSGREQRESPLGLTKKALEILAAIPKGSLKEGEHIPILLLQMDLFLMAGYADKVAEAMRDEKIRQLLGPLFLAKFEVFAGGAFSDFAMLDQGAAIIEKQFRAEIRELVKALPGGILFGMLQSPEENVIGSIAYQTFNRINRLHDKQNELCNVMTLRGIAALESGDTAKARDLFNAIFTESGEDFLFSERPIAVHYRRLLNAQRAQ